MASLDPTFPEASTDLTPQERKHRAAVLRALKGGQAKADRTAARRAFNAALRARGPKLSENELMQIINELRAADGQASNSRFPQAEEV